MSTPPAAAEPANQPTNQQAPLSEILQAAALSIARLLAGHRLPEGIAHAAQIHGLYGRSRAALQDVAFETTRRLGWGQALARLLNNKRPDPELYALQLVALVQLEHVLGAAQPARHPAVVVDQAVIAARVGNQHPGRGAFLNAILRRFQRERDALNASLANDSQARYNLPDWWLKQLQLDYPEHWPAIIAAQSQAAPLTLRVNRRRANRADLLQAFRDDAIVAQPVGLDGIALARSLDVTAREGFAEGWFSVQDAGAQLAAYLLDVSPGQRILDACAAPGGKTAHLLERHDAISLLAIDSDGKRLARVHDNLQRLGLQAEMLGQTKVQTQVADAALPQSWWDGRPFDRILLDVPCTASGIVRRHPDIPWLRKRGDIATLADQQWRLLNALWPLLRAGGKLLYATCSVFRAEGAQVVKGFMQRNPDASVLTLDWNWAAGMNSPTSTSKPGEPATAVFTAEATLQFLPTRSDLTSQASDALVRDHDGFFYALLQKRAG